MTVPGSRRVRQEDPQAEKNDRQVGEQFVIVDFAHHAAFAQEANVRQFVGDGSNESHWIAEAGFVDANHELAVRLFVSSRRGWKVLAGIVDEPDIGRIRNELQRHQRRHDIHVLADTIEQGADRLFGAVVCVGKELRRRQYQRAAIEGVIVEFLAEPDQSLFDPGLGGGIAGARWGKKPFEHRTSPHAARKLRGRLRLRRVSRYRDFSAVSFASSSCQRS